MKVVLSGRAIEALKDAPTSVRRAFDKQLRFLAHNLAHPSPHAKKYDEAEDFWQARIQWPLTILSSFKHTPPVLCPPWTSEDPESRWSERNAEALNARHYIRFWIILTYNIGV